MSSENVTYRFNPAQQGGYDISGLFVSPSVAATTSGLAVESIYSAFNGQEISKAIAGLTDATFDLSYKLSNGNYVFSDPIQVSFIPYKDKSQMDLIESQSDNFNHKYYPEYGVGMADNFALLAVGGVVINNDSVRGKTESDVKIDPTTSSTLQAQLSSGNDILFSFLSGSPNQFLNGANLFDLVHSSNVQLTVSGVKFTNLPVIDQQSSRQPILDDVTAQPFSGVQISDPGLPDGYTTNSIVGNLYDTISVTILDAQGNATDSLGTLSGNGITAIGNGAYTVAGHSTAELEANLTAMRFNPYDVSVASSNGNVATFQVTYTSASGGTTTDSTTSVVISHDLRKVTSDTVPSGTDRQPFSALSNISVSDPYSGDALRAVITVEHGTGVLQGPGLQQTATDTYQLDTDGMTVDQFNAALKSIQFVAKPGYADPGTTAYAQLGVTISSPTDGWSDILSQKLAINYADTKAPIPGTSKRLIVDVNSQPTALSIGAPTDDQSPSDPLNVSITALPSNGSVSYKGQTLARGDIIDVEELENLVFTPTPDLANQKSSLTYAISDAAGNSVNASVEIDVAPARSPVIENVSKNQSFSGTAITPFAHIALEDPNNGHKDSLTIIITGQGRLDDGKNSKYKTLTQDPVSGYFSITGTVEQIQQEMQELVYTPSTGSSSGNATTFSLGFLSSAGTWAAANTTVTLPGSDAPTQNGNPIADGSAPTLTGLADATTTSEAWLNPFVNAVLSDPSPNAVDNLTIALSGAGGTLAGAGLVANPDGSFTLAGTAAQVTAALQGLTFTPLAGQVGTASTTTFTLTASGSASTATASATARVTDIDPAPSAPVPVTAPTSIQPAVPAPATGTAAVAPAAVTVDNQDGSTTTTVQNPDGTSSVTTAGGSAFAGKPYSAVISTYAADGSLLTEVRDRNDGSHYVAVMQGSQTLQTNFFDTVANGGAPSNTFIFDPGHGLDVITQFRVDGTDHDTLSFLGDDFGNDIANVLRNTHNAPGGIVIQDPTSGDTVKLVGITKIQLAQNRGDIIFHS